MRARDPARRDEDMRGTSSAYGKRVGWRCSPSGVLELAVNLSHRKMMWLEAGRGTPPPNSSPDCEICSMKVGNPVSRGDNARETTPKFWKRVGVPCPPSGFSLIELMVVLVILGLLTGLVGPQLFGQVDSSKVQTAETQIKMLRGALQTYRLDIGTYPSTDEGLEALMRAPVEVADYWNGPYLEDELPTDPWREPYKYEHPAETMQGFALYSLGADSESGGEDISADIGYLPE